MSVNDSKTSPVYKTALVESENMEILEDQQQQGKRQKLERETDEKVSRDLCKIRAGASSNLSSVVKKETTMSFVPSELSTSPASSHYNSNKTADSDDEIEIIAVIQNSSKKVGVDLQDGNLNEDQKIPAGTVINRENNSKFQKQTVNSAYRNKILNKNKIQTRNVHEIQNVTSMEDEHSLKHSELTACESAKRQGDTDIVKLKEYAVCQSEVDAYHRVGPKLFQKPLSESSEYLNSTESSKSNPFKELIDSNINKSCSDNKRPCSLNKIQRINATFNSDSELSKNDFILAREDDFSDFDDTSIARKPKKSPPVVNYPDIEILASDGDDVTHTEYQDNIVRTKDISNVLNSLNVLNEVSSTKELPNAIMLPSYVTSIDLSLSSLQNYFKSNPKLFRVDNESSGMKKNSSLQSTNHQATNTNDTIFVNNEELNLIGFPLSLYRTMNYQENNVVHNYVKPLIVSGYDLEDNLGCTKRRNTVVNVHRNRMNSSMDDNNIISDKIHKENYQNAVKTFNGDEAYPNAGKHFMKSKLNEDIRYDTYKVDVEMNESLNLNQMERVKLHPHKDKFHSAVASSQRDITSLATSSHKFDESLQNTFLSNVHPKTAHGTNQKDNNSYVSQIREKSFSENLLSANYKVQLNQQNFNYEDMRTGFSAQSKMGSNKLLPVESSLPVLYSSPSLNPTNSFMGLATHFSNQKQTECTSDNSSQFFKHNVFIKGTSTSAQFTTRTLSICLASEHLKSVVGYGILETQDVLLLMLQWNVDMLIQQPEIYDPPPLSKVLRKVRASYDTFEHYYNTYFPLMLLDAWQRIHVSWSDFQRLDPYSCNIKSYSVQNNYVCVDCEVVITPSVCSQNNFPSNGSILVVKYGLISCQYDFKCLGYVTNLTMKKGTDFHLLKLTFITVYTSEEINQKLPVRVHSLCNVRSILTQNDALLFLEKSLFLGSILNPVEHEYIRMDLPPPNSDPESTNGCIQVITNAILSRYPLPCFVVVRTALEAGRLSFIPLLINNMKISLQTKVLLCVRTVKVLEDIASWISLYKSLKLVIFNKRRDTTSQLQKYLLEELVNFEVSGATEIEIKKTEDAVVKARKKVFKECDVVLSLIRNAYNDSIKEFFAEAKGIDEVCCIVWGADSCTEPETLVPNLHGLNRLILIGNPELSAKTLSKITRTYGYGQSLFNRAYNLGIGV